MSSNDVQSKGTGLQAPGTQWGPEAGCGRPGRSAPCSPAWPRWACSPGDAHQLLADKPRGSGRGRWCRRSGRPCSPLSFHVFQNRKFEPSATVPVTGPLETEARACPHGLRWAVCRACGRPRGPPRSRRAGSWGVGGPPREWPQPLLAPAAEGRAAPSEPRVARPGWRSRFTGKAPAQTGRAGRGRCRRRREPGMGTPATVLPLRPLSRARR